MTPAPPPLPPSVPPFASTFTPEVPDLLSALRCSVVLSTYQAGRVVVFSPRGESLAQLNRAFDAPMGMAVDGHGADLRLAVATTDALHVLRNAPTLAGTYPNQPGTYDALLVPRATYYTGPLDLHDMTWDADGHLIAVNTRFSCLCRVDGRHAFEPLWSPPFVTALEPSDRCHLNGLAVGADGTPAFVSALGATDTPRGWSDGRLTGGVVLDVATGETVAAGLAMPHSPRVVDGTLYVLQSATGMLSAVDPASGTTTDVCAVGGFARGLARRGDYLFVGLSKIRGRSTFAGLPVTGHARHAGVVIVHAPSGQIAGSILFTSSAEEIYDVQVLPETARPGIVGPDQAVRGRAIPTEGGGFWALDAAPVAAA